MHIWGRQVEERTSVKARWKEEKNEQFYANAYISTEKLVNKIENRMSADQWMYIGWRNLSKLLICSIKISHEENIILRKIYGLNHFKFKQWRVKLWILISWAFSSIIMYQIGKNMWKLVDIIDSSDTSGSFLLCCTKIVIFQLCKQNQLKKMFHFTLIRQSIQTIPNMKRRFNRQLPFHYVKQKS